MSARRSPPDTTLRAGSAWPAGRRGSSGAAFTPALCAARSVPPRGQAGCSSLPPYLLGCARPSRVRAREVRRCRHGCSPPAAGEGSEVLFPGEHEQRTAEERSRNGIYVEDKTWAALQALDQA
jgi:hypothetical protein